MNEKNIKAVFSDDLGDLPDSSMIREKVFVEEQGFVNEFDETDKQSVHCVLYIDGKCASAARMFSEDGRVIHIGRIAVLREFRGTGLGAETVKACEKYAYEHGYERCELSAQVRVKGFYEKLGYAAYGDEYLDEYCPHIDMYKEM